jgi:hypothetical protein
MAAKSNSQGDINTWIEKIINSCDQYNQTFAASQLIHLFDKRLVDQGTERYIRRHITDLLYSRMWSKKESFITTKTLLKG